MTDRLTVGEGIVRDPIPEKTYAGSCVGIFLLGKQFHPRYKHWRAKILFMFEIPQVRIEINFDDGSSIDRPRLASRIYGFTLSDRGFLKPMLTAWNGSSFEVGDEIVPKDFLGRPAAVQITHGKDGNKIYSNIGSINELMEGVSAPEIETDLMYFAFADHDTLEEVEEALDAIPDWADWVTDKIRASEEYQSMVAKAHAPTGVSEEPVGPEYDDEPPF